jgi:CubicO group peptidase (beta-lactamase class C family)
MKFVLFLLIILTSNVFAFSEELEAIRSKYNLPALSAGLLMNGELQIEAVGVRKLGNPEKVTTNDKWHLGSNAKSMTAVLVATLIEQGKLKWTSTLEELFPDYPIHAQLKNVTIEMLLAHRSGLRRGLTGRFSTRAEAVRALLLEAPEKKPDTTDLYSNAGYVVAGHALEKIMNKTWERIIHELLFGPLKMSSCGFGTPTGNSEEAIPSQPWGHYSNKGVITPINEDNSEILGPAGTIHCSLSDWAKYLQFHLDGFNQGKEKFKKLHTVYSGSQINYTPGGLYRLEREWAKGVAFTHTGTNLVNYANVWIAPNLNAGFMVVTNMGGDETFSGNDEVLRNTWKAMDETIGLLIKSISATH